MLKGFPKCMKNHPKIHVEVSWGDLFFDFRRLGEWQKKQDFCYASPVAQKSEKSFHERLRGRNIAPELSSRVSFPTPGVHGAATRAR